MPNANWSNPTLTSTYTNFLSEVKNRDEDLALQFDGTTSTNILTNTIRWDSSANRWKKWNGTAWAELTSLYALTGLSTTGNASIGGTFGVTGAATFSSTLGVTGALTGSSTVSGTALIPTSATIPANGVYLPGANTVGIATGGVAAALVDDNGDLSIYNAAGTFNHRFANQPTANRTVTLPDADVTLVAGTMAPTASPAFTGTPTAPTASVGTNTTQIATTAFVLANASSFPAGTAMLFVQTAAPTGWTKSTTHDNKALRVVSGTASSGGTTAFTTVFASRTPAGTIANTTSTGTVAATTLTTAQMPSHTHSDTGCSNYTGFGGEMGSFQTIGTAAAFTSGATGGGGSHTHGLTMNAHNHTFTGTALDFAVQYVDVIIATKN